MRKAWCTISVLAMLLLVACSNTTEPIEQSIIYHDSTAKEDEMVHWESDKKMPTAPTVMSDLFDGERRVWFYLDNEDFAYDIGVAAVFVTEDKTVTEFYYNLVDPGYGGSQMIGAVSGKNPNPFSCERFALGDFEGLSDDEIIKKVRQFYGDASVEYALSYKYVDITESFSVPRTAFPYVIRYGGELDSSGNNLKNERLSFSERNLLVNIGKGSYRYAGVKVDCAKFEVDSIIKPTAIKDKVYVGIKDDSGHKIVTVNDYSAFGNIAYDDPSNATEW